MKNIIKKNIFILLIIVMSIFLLAWLLFHEEELWGYVVKLIKTLYAIILFGSGAMFMVGYDKEVSNLKGDQHEGEKTFILIKRLFIGISLLMFSYLMAGI